MWLKGFSEIEDVDEGMMPSLLTAPAPPRAGGGSSRKSFYQHVQSPPSGAGREPLPSFPAFSPLSKRQPVELASTSQ